MGRMEDLLEKSKWMVVSTIGDLFIEVSRVGGGARVV